MIQKEFSITMKKTGGRFNINIFLFLIRFPQDHYNKNADNQSVNKLGYRVYNKIMNIY